MPPLLPPWTSWTPHPSRVAGRNRPKPAAHARKPMWQIELFLVGVELGSQHDPTGKRGLAPLGKAQLSRISPKLRDSLIPHPRKTNRLCILPHTKQR